MVGETEDRRISQLAAELTLTVHVDSELLGVIWRNSIESFADVSSHVSSVDVSDVEDGRRHIAD